MRTSTPSASGAWLQVIPNSSRLIRVVAEKANFRVPHGSVTVPKVLCLEGSGAGEIAGVLGRIAAAEPISR